MTSLKSMNRCLSADDFIYSFPFNCRYEDKDITNEDLYLLCDLFYLPFEHGSRALQLINEFYWLKTNATVLVNSYKKGQDLATAKPEVCSAELKKVLLIFMDFLDFRFRNGFNALINFT